ncbi:hypothetical protein FHX42_003331 [Saccharopolyspora lacisalsi]|uniref:Glucose-methanol-choline oxidoreductase N-terminal domain-containing protein n=1 Tax=Halosaccharopolyspora lacisalsi TaxID=1000566 RepID=A0A839E2J7_9PSEU|nr:hypothetical protein [Halosaccharopolyspora lacisalsi]
MTTCARGRNTEPRGWGTQGTRPCFERVFERAGIGYDSPDDAARAFIEAGEQADSTGRPMEADAEREGGGRGAVKARDGVRRPSSVAYLHPLSGPPDNLTVLTDTQALRLRVDDGGEVDGVETSRGPCVLATRSSWRAAFSTPP